MIEQYNPSTRIIDLTVGQLVELIEGVNARSRVRFDQPAGDEPAKHYVRGLGGIADIIGCSRGTVCRLKKLGVFDEAISQCGHIIVADADKVVECFKSFQKTK